MQVRVSLFIFFTGQRYGSTKKYYVKTKLYLLKHAKLRRVSFPKNLRFHRWNSSKKMITARAKVQR